VYRSWLFVLRSVTWSAHLFNGSLLAVVTRALSPTTLAVTPLAVRPEWLLPVWLVTLAIVGGGAIRKLRSTTNPDQAWLLVGVCAFLLSPLGWVYYAPLLTGPLIARWQTAGRITRVWIAVGFACFCVPYALLMRSLGPVATLVFASVYTWGFLTWFIAAVVPVRRVAV
jgi:hypothetical protein